MRNRHVLYAKKGFDTKASERKTRIFLYMQYKIGSYVTCRLKVFFDIVSSFFDQQYIF